MTGASELTMSTEAERCLECARAGRFERLVCCMARPKVFVEIGQEVGCVGLCAYIVRRGRLAGLHGDNAGGWSETA